MRERSSALHRIIEEIGAGGPMTFARFMEIALYEASDSYYGSERARIGRQGDFFTNPSVGPVFGAILAGQFEEVWRALGKPRPFVITEQGANTGQLAWDILTALHPEMRPAVEFCIVEPCVALAEKQKERLSELPDRVHWVENVNALPRFTGIHFSNELVDALPFHLVCSDCPSWKELYVDAAAGVLEFRAGAPSQPIAQFIRDLPVRPRGFLTELRPAAAAWLRVLCSRLVRGAVLIVDYGYDRDELLAPHRTQGTFSCYRAHHRDFHPLDQPGAKDITAHVDFTALAEEAIHAGLDLKGFTDQHHFLVGASERLLKELEGPPDAPKQRTLRQLQTLLHPGSMGMQFRYMMLSRGVEEPVSGFRYARDLRTELGITQTPFAPESPFRLGAPTEQAAKAREDFPS